METGNQRREAGEGQEMGEKRQEMGDEDERRDDNERQSGRRETGHWARRGTPNLLKRECVTRFSTYILLMIGTHLGPR